MFDMQFIVYLILGLLVCAGVLGLLWFLIGYWESKIHGFPMAFNVIRLIFVTLVVLLAIGFLMSLLNGQQMFRWGRLP